MRRLALALLLIASPARADDPPRPVVPVASITAPASVPAGSPLVLYGDQAVSSGPLSWKLITPRVAFQVFDQGDRKGVLLVIPHPDPGLYRFAQVAKGQGGDFDVDFADVVVIAPPPDPKPVPPAPPVPVPVPTPSLAPPFWVEVVTDPSAPPTSAAIRAAAVADSVTIAPAVRAMGGYFQPVPVASAEFGRRGLSRFVGAGGVAAPALVVRDAKGNKVIAEPLPADEAAVLARVKSLIGGGQ